MFHRFIATVVLLLILATGASAQSEKKSVFYAGLGISVPTGTLDEGWNLGFHGRGAVGFLVSEPRSKTELEIIGEVAYHSFALDKMGTGATGGAASAIQIGAGPKVTFSSESTSLKFFIAGTVGVGIVDVADLTIPGFGTFQTEGETKLYFNPSIGVELGKSAFISAGYVSIATSGEAFAYIPLTVGMHF